MATQVWTDNSYGPGVDVVPQGGALKLGHKQQKWAEFNLAPSGEFTATGSTEVVVADTNVTADSLILWSLKTVGGTPAAVYESSAKVPGTSFSIKSTAGNTSVYNYWIIG